MQMDWQFYRGWFDWVVGKAEELAKKGDFLSLTLFLREMLQVVWSLVGLVENVRGIFRGNALKVGLAVLDFAKKNPDPLGPSRQQMRELRLKWGEVAGTPVGPVPFASEPSG